MDGGGLASDDTERSPTVFFQRQRKDFLRPLRISNARVDSPLFFQCPTVSDLIVATA